MHELSIAQALIAQLEELTRKEHARRIISATVIIGSLSGVDHEALKFAFPIAAEDTLAKDAKLIIEDARAKVACKTCKKESHPTFPFLSCVKCGSSDVEILSGRELVLKSMDVET